MEAEKAQSSEPKAPPPKHSNLASQEIASIALRIAIEQKGRDAAAIELGALSDVADYFVIVSGTSERHVSGIADKVKDTLKLSGEAPISTSGYGSSEWVLLDYGDVVVHVFYEPTRQFYKLDELWDKAPRLPLDPELEDAAKKLRTGLFY